MNKSLKFTIICLAAVSTVSAFDGEFLRNLQTANTSANTTTTTTVSSKGSILSGPVYNSSSTACTLGTKESCNPGYCCGYFYNI